MNIPANVQDHGNRLPAVIAFNHLFIDRSPLTGPGYYAVELLESLVTLPHFESRRIDIRVFIRGGTRHHYSKQVQRYLVETSFPGGRFARVIYEQLVLPWRSRASGSDLLFSPGFVSPAFGAPVLAATIHDMYYRVMPDAVESKQRMYWKLGIPFTSRVCDLLLTVSENSGRDIERYLPAARGKIVVTPLASRFDFSTFSGAGPLDPSKRPYVVMIASLTANKNVGKVIEALAILRDRGTVVDFVHIGADLHGELASAKRTFGMADQVRSLGKVSDEELVAAARESLCVVVASLYEGFGLPAIEAQALGAPLVCSTAGALPEVAGEAALMFDPDDADALANQIKMLIDNSDLREDLRRRGRANAGRFSWQRTAELTLAAFDRQLKRVRGTQTT